MLLSAESQTSCKQAGQDSIQNRAALQRHNTHGSSKQQQLSCLPSGDTAQARDERGVSCRGTSKWHVVADIASNTSSRTKHTHIHTSPHQAHLLCVPGPPHQVSGSPPPNHQILTAHARAWSYQQLSTCSSVPHPTIPACGKLPPPSSQMMPPTTNTSTVLNTKQNGKQRFANNIATKMCC